MTITEACKRYNIPHKIRQEYESLGLLASKTEAPDWECGDQDMEALNLLILLHESGFGPKEAKAYLAASLQRNAAVADCLKILNRKRKQMLEEIHQRETQLDRLDYLRYELQKQAAKQKGEQKP